MIKESYWKDGVFYPDQTPVEMPLGYEHPESLAQMVARMVQDARLSANDDVDSIDDCEDFDVMDDEPIVSRHEFTEMQEEYVSDVKRAAKDAESKLSELQHPTETPVVSPNQTPEPAVAKPAT